ncbi:MAG: hypothetical protein GY867_00670 [bacterium]|nr:hypothetical protein [bacterium]
MFLDNGRAKDAAEQALELRIKTSSSFTASDVIKDVIDQGLTASDWRCIGSMFSRAHRQGRIGVLGLANSPRPSRHHGDQKVWISYEAIQ